METVVSVLASIQKRDIMFLRDLKDAYFQIPVHSELRSYVQFAVNERIYQLKFYQDMVAH